MNTFRAETSCPYCMRAISQHAPVRHSAAPVPGDLCVCAYCFGLSMFQDGPFGLTLRILTPEEFVDAREEYSAILKRLRVVSPRMPEP